MEEIGAPWSTYYGSVTGWTRLTIVPSQQMSHQLINFLVLAPR